MCQNQNSLMMLNSLIQKKRKAQAVNQSPSQSLVQDQNLNQALSQIQAAPTLRIHLVKQRANQVDQALTAILQVKNHLVMKVKVTHQVNSLLSYEVLRKSKRIDFCVTSFLSI